MFHVISNKWQECQRLLPIQEDPDHYDPDRDADIKWPVIKSLRISRDEHSIEKDMFIQNVKQYYKWKMSHDDWVFYPIEYYRRILGLLRKINLRGIKRKLYCKFDNSLNADELLQCFCQNKFSDPIYLSYRITSNKYGERLYTQDYEMKFICQMINESNNPVYFFTSASAYRAQEYNRDEGEFSDSDCDENDKQGEVYFASCAIRTKNNSLVDKNIMLSSYSLETLLQTMYQLIDPKELEHLMYDNNDNVEIKEFGYYKKHPIKISNHSAMDMCQHYITMDYLRREVFPYLQQYFCPDVENVILHYV